MVVLRLRRGLVVWVVLVLPRVAPVRFVNPNRLVEAWKEGITEMIPGFGRVVVTLNLNALSFDDCTLPVWFVFWVTVDVPEATVLPGAIRRIVTVWVETLDLHY